MQIALNDFEFCIPYAKITIFLTLETPSQLYTEFENKYVI